METRTAPRLIGGRYRIDSLLGEGGMARVFDAFDERLERPVAVKILREETQALPGMRKRFQQEALIAARLVHSNIVAVLDFGEDHSASYLVMERLPGITLRDEIIRGPLPKPRVMRVMAELLAALAAAHKFGVLHRDIKPSNILLQEDGQTKITDFGIAKSFDIRMDPQWVADDATMTGVVLGTPGYLAPERRAGQPATVQSDIYAVGAVMVETLTGRRFDPAALPTEQLPPSLRDIASRALATDPLDRFASAGEMLHTLRTRAAETAPMARPAPRRAQAPATATMPVRPPATPPGTPPGTAVPPPPPLSGTPARPTRVRRRRRGVFAAVAGLALVAALFLLLEGGVHPTAHAASTAKHRVAHQVSRPTDSEASAIEALATSLANGGLPGDAPLAEALDATAAQQPGADRQSSAQQDLSLAQVLLNGGGITAGQYQDVVNVLVPTGATVTTTPTTATPTPAPAPSLPGQPLQGHGHGHGLGGGPGAQGSHQGW